MHKQIKIMLTVGLSILCLIVLFSLLDPSESKKQKSIMKAFLKEYYSAQSCDRYIELFKGNLDILELLYNEQYKKLLTEDIYGTLVADRVILESEKVVQRYNCKVSLKSSSFKKVKSQTIDGYPSFLYVVKVKLDFGNHDIRNILLSGTLDFIKQDEDWIISGFTPQESIFDAVEERQYELKKVFDKS